MMVKIMIISILIGVILITISFINVKSSTNRKKIYKKSFLKNILKNIRESSFIASLSDDTKGKNKGLREKIELINKCRLSELQYRDNVQLSKEYKDKKKHNLLKNLYIARIVVIGVVLVTAVFLKINFNSISVKEILDYQNINKTSQYRISKNDAQDILNYIGNDYKRYFNHNKEEQFFEVISNYINDQKLNLDSSDAQFIFNCYKQAADKHRLNPIDILILFILAFCCNYLVVLYVNLRYRICNLKMTKEFERIELIAILNMNRDAINIYEIINEVADYAVYLKPYLQKCLNSYTSNPKQALKQLSNDIEDENFTNFIAILENCLDKPKDTNFEILKLQRRLRYLNEKIDNDKDLRFKSICLTLVQYPLMFMFMVNMLVPFISGIDLKMTI